MSEENLEPQGGGAYDGGDAPDALEGGGAYDGGDAPDALEARQGDDNITITREQWNELVAEIRRAAQPQPAVPGGPPPVPLAPPIRTQEPNALVLHDGRWGRVVRRFYDDEADTDRYDVELLSDVRFGLRPEDLAEP